MSVINWSSRWPVGLVTCTCLSLVCAFAPGCRKPAADGSSKTKVLIGYLPMVAQLPAEVARVREGFEGDQVEFRIFGTSNDLLSALCKGDVDLATTIAVPPVAALASKYKSENKVLPIKIVSLSETTSDNPFDSVFTMPDSPIKTIADLKGRRVGIFPGTTARNMLAALLRSKYNVDPGLIEWFPLPPGNQLQELRVGNVDALYTYETTRTTLELNGMRQIHGSVVADWLPDAPYGCSAINCEFARKHPEQSLRIVGALDKAIEYTRTHETEVRQVLIDRLDVAPAIANSCHIERRLTSKEIQDPKRIEHLQAFIEILVAAKDVGPNAVAKDLIWCP